MIILPNRKQIKRMNIEHLLIFIEIENIACKKNFVSCDILTVKIMNN